MFLTWFLSSDSSLNGSNAIGCSNSNHSLATYRPISAQEACKIFFSLIYCFYGFLNLMTYIFAKEIFFTRSVRFKQFFQITQQSWKLIFEEQLAHFVLETIYSLSMIQQGSLKTNRMYLFIYICLFKNWHVLKNDVLYLIDNHVTFRLFYISFTVELLKKISFCFILISQVSKTIQTNTN
jgi:hypothetical protein